MRIKGDNRIAWLLFIIGVFTSTRINLGGSIALAEIAMLVATPFVLSKEWVFLRKCKAASLVMLAFLWFVGACFADWHNGTYFKFAAKGIATPVVYFCCIVCLFSLLRRDISNLRWLVLGFAVSMIVSTFVFSRASSLEVEEIADNAFERTVSYKLFWINLMLAWTMVPIKGWYLKIPNGLAYLIMTCASVQAFLTGARSCFVMTVVSFVFIIFAHRSVGAIVRTKKRMFFILAMLAMAAVCAKTGYKYAAKSGMIGEYEQKKLERQTREGDSLLKMLMAGRVEFFVSLAAAVEHPLAGLGSWAFDWNGFYPEFVSKYGSAEDAVKLANSIAQSGGICKIPAHSHIATYWMWHGIFALLFWLYVGYLVFTTLLKRLPCVPGLYGYLVTTIPMFAWDFFFSPVCARISESTLFVVCLLVRYYDKNKMGERLCM